MKIKTINLNSSSEISSRTTNPESTRVRNFSILQTDGSFFVAYPTINKVIWYPQSPNNVSKTLLQEIVEFTSFGNYGNLKWPMDVQVDSNRRILYIADTGNNAVLKIDLNTRELIKSYAINNPVSIVINQNTGGFFTRYIIDSNYHGIIYYQDDKIEENIEFPHKGPYPIDSINRAFFKEITSTNSIAFDEVRNKLWWVGSKGSNSYSMMESLGYYWKEKDSSRDWKSISISSNGQYQSACAYNDYIYVSSDYGETWTAKKNIGKWRVISISGDGRYQIAGDTTYGFYVSSDYGETWIYNKSSSPIISASLSYDGKYQTVGLKSKVMISSDYGSIWVNKKFSSSSSLDTYVSISSDGKYQSSAIYGDKIWISVDYGTTWISKTQTRDWKGISISNDGRYQIAIVGNGYIYVSSDNGNTWETRNSVRNWQDVSITGDGQYQVAIVDNGFFYISNNYGKTWSETIPTGYMMAWKSISLSNNINYVAIVGQSTRINISSIMTSASLLEYWKKKGFGEGTRYTGVAISNNGQYQAVNIIYHLNSGVYASNNYGQTWNCKIAKQWNYNICMSNTGQYQAFVSYETGRFVGYLSSDYGINWSNAISRGGEAGLGVYDIDISGNGQYLLFANQYGLYKSNTYGVSWTTALTNIGINCVAISDSGQYQIAGNDWQGSNADIYVSSNYGVTWTNKNFGNTYGWISDIAISGNGKYQMASAYRKDMLFRDDLLWSSDYGNTWASIFTKTYFCRAISLSFDGKYQFFNGSPDGQYNPSGFFSSDYGNTWSTYDSLNVNLIDSSAFSDNEKYFIFVRDSEYTDDYSIYHPGLHTTTTDYMESNAYVGTITSYIFDMMNNNIAENPIEFTSATGDNNTNGAIDVDLNTGNMFFIRETGYQYLSSCSSVVTTSRPININELYKSAISYDGKYQIVTSYYLDSYGTRYKDAYKSDNYGNSWSRVISYILNTVTLADIAMSSDGKYQTIVKQVSSPSSNTSFINISSNYGVSWTEKLFKIYNMNFTSIAISEDGQLQVTSTYNDGGYSPYAGRIIASRDFWDTWEILDAPINKNYSGIAISHDGKYQTAVESPGYIYVSSDYGKTWSIKGPSTSYSWDKIIMSPDGKCQAAKISSIGVYHSTDYGNTWNLLQSVTANLPSCSYISMSLNGNILMSAWRTNNGYNKIYSVINYGKGTPVETHSNNQPGVISSLSLSEDGSLGIFTHINSYLGKIENTLVYSSNVNTLVSQISYENRLLIGSGYASNSINNIVISQTGNDIIPFTFLIESNPNSKESYLNFDINNINDIIDFSQLTEISNLNISQNNIYSASNSSAHPEDYAYNNVYVPYTDNSLYKHDSVFRADILIKNSSLKEYSLRTQPEIYSYKTPNNVRNTPRFTWTNQINGLEDEDTIDAINENIWVANSSEIYLVNSSAASATSIGFSSDVFSNIKNIYQGENNILYISEKYLRACYNPKYIDSQEFLDYSNVYNQGTILTLCNDDKIIGINPYYGQIEFRIKDTLEIEKVVDGIDSPKKILWSKYHDCYLIAGSNILWKYQSEILPTYLIGDWRILDFDVAESGQIILIMQNPNSQKYIARILDKDIFTVLYNNETTSTLSHCKYCENILYYIEVNFNSVINNYLYNLNNNTINIVPVESSLFVSNAISTTTTTTSIPSKKIEIINPIKYELIKKGENYTIQWKSSASINDSVKIELYKNSTQIEIINDNAPNNGEYQWMVKNYDNGENYFIKITWLAAGNESNFDFSDIFTISDLSEATTTTTTTPVLLNIIGIEYNKYSKNIIFITNDGFFGVLNIIDLSINTFNTNIKNIITTTRASKNINAFTSINKVRVFVGSDLHLNDMWDSGEVETTLTSMYYGGGNNLKPGNTYYVNIQVYSDVYGWSDLQTQQFTMPS